MTYQWFKNDAEISGQTKNKLSLRGIGTGDAGIYKLVATNPAGTLELEATLAVTAASTYVGPLANNLAEDSLPSSLAKLSVPIRQRDKPMNQSLIPLKMVKAPPMSASATRRTRMRKECSTFWKVLPT